MVQIPTPPSHVTEFLQFMRDLYDMRSAMSAFGEARRVIHLNTESLLAQAVLAAPEIRNTPETSQMAWTPPGNPNLESGLSTPPAEAVHATHESEICVRAFVAETSAWASHYAALFEFDMVPFAYKFKDLRTALSMLSRKNDVAPAEVASFAKARIAAIIAVDKLRMLMAIVHTGAEAEKQVGHRAVEAARKEWSRQRPNEQFFGWNEVRWESYVELYQLEAHCADLEAEGARALNRISALLA